MSRPITRRTFLKAAAVAGGLMVAPSMAGYKLHQIAQGEFPPTVSPYVDDSIEKSATMPDVPLLILTDNRSANRYGKYWAEILRTEGLNCFRELTLASLTPAVLEMHDIVLLAEGTLTTDQVELLESWVNRGGRLAAMRPDARLAPVLGLERLSGSTTEGYLQVNTEQSIAQGIVTESLQFHGTADHYRLAGAETVAWLSSSASVPKNLPALTINQYGQGLAAMWAFDLATSILLTRQGNPALANIVSPAWEGLRTVDLFRDWIDLDRLAIPQADELQRLFANLLTALSITKTPLPRLWYFPGDAPSMLIATSDSHGNRVAALEDMIQRIERRHGHVSVYYLAYPESDLRRTIKRGTLELAQLPVVGDFIANDIRAPSHDYVARLRARGHEFALHPAVDNEGPFDDLEEAWRVHWQEFTGMGYGPVPKTVRTHRIAWRGWVDTARIQASHGIRMNMDFYHWGPLFQSKNKEWLFGYLTGSGLPMKFIDEQGYILNIYQQLTEFADDHMLDLHWGGWAKLPPEKAIEVSRETLRKSLKEYPSAIVNHVHTDPFEVGGFSAQRAGKYLEGTLDAAVEFGIPIWSGEQWFKFTQVRHDAEMEVQWNMASNRLQIELSSAVDPDVELSMMIPLTHGQSKLVRMHIDNEPVKFSEHWVGGVLYGKCNVVAGKHQIIATFA